ncbi:SDR family oxidoreductase [Salinisphaera sp. SPP-AMP-43]|uniref:SDR family NAD(P)-dependent oxidoreductase n=1 Tax=Salinisphaera sp. SPP-AMP-43 TaxID=3121288 RepID=UPI003C6E19D4
MTYPTDFLNTKVVIITGGSSGIGLAAARQFAEHGAHVLVTGRRHAPLKELASNDDRISTLVADATKAEDADRTIDRAITLWGRLDVLVNNAGAGDIMPLIETTTDRITAVFAGNVLGPSLHARAALPHLTATKGAIINVSSTLGQRATASLAHYAASKAALEHLTRCWALELAPLKIRVNAVAPGPTNTGALTGMMGLSSQAASEVRDKERLDVPLRRRGEPAEVARWIVSLAEPAACWVTGQIITVDGGFGLA